MSRPPTESKRASSIVDREPFLLMALRLIQEVLALAVHILRWLSQALRVGGWSRRRLAVSAVLLFVLATGNAIRQYVQPFVWHEPYPILRLQWWSQPLEWNVDSGLPQIVGNINAVSSVPEKACLWIAGDKGLLAFSKDQGQTWTALSYDPTTGDFHAPDNSAPCVAARVNRAWFSLTQKVYAASGEGRSPPQVQHSNAAQKLRAQAQQTVSQGKTGNAQEQLPRMDPRNSANQGTGNSQSDAETKRVNVSQDPRISPPSSAPDLWGFHDTRTLGDVYTNQADIYSTQNGGQSWTWKRSPAVENSLTVTVSDKQLEFEQEPATGAYHLQSVTGRSWTTGFDAIQWNPAAHDFNVFTDNTNGPGNLHEMQSSKPDGDIIALSFPGFSGTQTGWAINYTTQAIENSRNPSSSATSQVLYTTDGARTWTVLKSFTGERLKSMHFRGDIKTGWVTGDNGVLLSTADGGASWRPLSRNAARLLRLGMWSEPKDVDPYVHFVAPWYLAALLICGVLATPVLFPVDETEAPPTAVPESRGDKTHRPTVAGDREADASIIGNQAIADKPLEPGDPDALGLSIIAAGLAFFLRNQKTRPPLAIAINGRWGSGKTSLMNLLKSNLEAWGAHPVWFNAWHHQKEDQMLAALLQAVKTQAVPPLWQVSGWAFRSRLAWRRLRRSWFDLVLLVTAVFVIYKAGIFVAGSFKLSVTSLLNWISSGKASTEITANLAGKPILTILTSAGAIYKVVSSGLTAFGSNPASLLASVSGGTKIQDLDAQTSFRQRFASEFSDVTQSLGKNQRMLILIDDLDRCRPEKVREVLEGVNFLASSGDCFIVLGMARDIVEHCVGLSFAPVVDTMTWEALGLSPQDIEQAIEEARSTKAHTGVSQPVLLVGGKTPTSIETYAKRRAYARLYLDKLIQIEVSVPEPTPLQRRLLFRTEEEIQKERDANEQRVQDIVARSRRIYMGMQPLMGIALAGVMLFGLWTLTRSTIRGWVLELAAIPTPPTGSTWNAPPADQRGTNGLRSKSPNPNSTSPDVLSRATTGANAETNPLRKPEAPISEGVFPYGPTTALLWSPTIEEYGAGPWEKGWIAGWPFYLVALGTISLLATSLRRLPQRIVRDEAPFTNALAVWHPLVMTGGAKNTPRTARRFQNKVRYLAMRQRALLRGKAMSLGERWLRERLHAPLPRVDRPVHLPETEDISSTLVKDAGRVRELIERGENGKVGSWEIEVSTDRVNLSSATVTDIDDEQFKALVLGNVYIPEPLLVALSAIEEYAPSGS